MDCVSFSKAFQDNMRALRLDAPMSLFVVVNASRTLC